MHQGRFFLTAFIFCFIKIHTQICSPLPDSTDLIQTGFNTLLNNYSIQRQHCFSVQITNFDPADRKVQVVASTGKIDQIQSSTPLGFDYFIKAYVKQNSIQISVFINENNLWQSMTVSYLISSRPDFTLGYFIPNQISHSSCELGINSLNKVVSRFIIPDWKSTPSSKYQYIYLISGLQIKGAFKSIGIIQADFNQNNGEIIVKTSINSTSSIQYLQISYVVIQSIDFFYVAQYNPLNNLNAGDYTIRYFFQGINQFYQNNGVAAEGYSFKKNHRLQCIGTKCTQNCISGQNCLNNNGNIYNNQCYFCQQNQSFNNGKCINLQVNCQVNQHFEGNTCVCNVGFVRINGICQVSCPSFTYYNGNQCICIPGYINIGAGCAPQCPINKYLNQFNICICNNGYVLNPNGSCTLASCGSNQVFRSTSNSCQCINGYLRYNNICQAKCPNFQNAVIINGDCRCIQNFTFVNGNCKSNSLVNQNCIKPHEILFNNSCQCEKNYTYNSAKECVIACQQNFTLSVSGQCVCQFNYVKIGNSCYQRCGQNGYRFGSTCICNNGYRLFENTCISICSINQDYNVSSNWCQCKIGFGLNNNQTCILCPSNSFINASGYCNCNQNYFLSENSCISICPQNFFYNQTNKVCMCLPPFKLMINGSCQICPTNSTYVGGNCICNSDFYKNGNTCSACYFSCSTCNNGLSSGCTSCINSYFLLNGQCVKLT